MEGKRGEGEIAKKKRKGSPLSCAFGSNSSCEESILPHSKNLGGVDRFREGNRGESQSRKLAERNTAALSDTVRE